MMFIVAYYPQYICLSFSQFDGNKSVIDFGFALLAIKRSLSKSLNAHVPLIRVRFRRTSVE
jgi:hypothetical protein